MRTDLVPEDLADMLRQPLIAVLATRRADDTVLLSPVWYEWRDGGFEVWVGSPEEGKVRHIRRDPRVSIVVANADPPYKGVEVRGKATILESAEHFYGVLERTARRYYGDERGMALVAEYPKPGVVLRIEPGDARAWDYGDEA
jgi:PPOX class probable F420-dependent enzyme